eukprot:TRINITY_DN422_c0_g1_i6.p1 TRINITY_DN422_c0_g1~~TRINITY_DN422_c0_g1_i6.p1  ORF type:complete len:475 (-),score=88.32 TRINITY_DN422_c0_g1_i6:220-1644(-)
MPRKQTLAGACRRGDDALIADLCARGAVWTVGTLTAAWRPRTGRRAAGERGAGRQAAPRGDCRAGRRRLVHQAGNQDHRQMKRAACVRSHSFAAPAAAAVRTSPSAGCPSAAPAGYVHRAVPRVQARTYFAAMETIPVLCTISEIVTSDGVTIAMFLKDISNLKAQEQLLEEQKRKTDLLLRNILPEAVISLLKKNSDELIATKYPSVTIAFADIVGFTPMASGMSPAQLVSMLNGLFCMWDTMLPYYRVEKVKTIGDCYMIAGGMPTANATHPEDVTEFCIAMFHMLHIFNSATGHDVHLRVGVNTGPVVAGVIGRTKWAYDMWGDAVNLASRLESSGVPDRIQVSEATTSVLREKGYAFESRGKIEIKGKGNTECFLLAEPKADQARRPLDADVLQQIRDKLETDFQHLHSSQHGSSTFGTGLAHNSARVTPAGSPALTEGALGAVFGGSSLVRLVTRSTIEELANICDGDV